MQHPSLQPLWHQRRSLRDSWATLVRGAQRAIRAHPYLGSVTVVAIVSVIGWLLQRLVAVPSALPVYLIGVLVCAITGGRRPAVVCACLGFIAYKFLFVPPIFTFSIDDSGDIVDVVTFIFAAVVTGGLAGKVREQADAARRRATELAALYELSQAISTQIAFERSAPVIVHTAQQLLGCLWTRLVVYDEHGTPIEVARTGQTRAGVAVIEAPLRCNATIAGRLQIGLPAQQATLSADDQHLLNTLAGQAALALERGRLAQAAARTQALAESDRLKSTLLAAISHDVRTPLASITAAADELAADDVAWSVEARQGFSHVIQTEAERLNRLLINLLDLTQLEGGVLRPQRGWYNIAEIVDGVVQRLAPDLADRRLTLEVPDDLPLVAVDFVQLEQVLWNLLQNALKYSPPGTPIMISANCAPSGVMVHIGDRGRGIPAAERERVFEKFYRLAGPDGARVPGSGIGLAICKGLIDAHGGQMTILGREGGGTVVEVVLPLEVPAGSAVSGG